MSDIFTKSRVSRADVSVATDRAWLKVQGLAKAFGGTRVLSNICAELHPGDVVLLAGINGAGKSTLIDALTGNVEPDAGSITFSVNGTTPFNLRFPRSRWVRANPWQEFRPDVLARRGVGRTWQHMRLFPRHTVRENVMLAAANPGERALEAWFHSSKTRKNELDLVQRADELLAQVGLGCRGDSSGDGISRGQAKRVAIARCLFGDQRVLFLDEPLSGLDRHGIEDVTQLLRDLAARRDSAMVIVEHITHLPALLDFATTVWKLENGSLFAAAPQQVRQELSTYKVDVHDWAKAWAGSCGERKFLPGGASLTVYSRCDADRNCLLDVRGLSVCRGAMAVLSDFNLRLCAGDLAILEAPNGWGKTTLAEAVAGLIPAKCGSVKTGGNELAHLPAWERRKKGLHFLPSRNQTFDSLTVAESFRVIETLVPDRWAQWQNRRVGTLSGGEKQKLALATFYSSNCSVRLLDEPFAALDTSGLNELRNNLFPNHENANLIMLPGWPEGDGA